MRKEVSVSYVSEKRRLLKRTSAKRVQKYINHEKGGEVNA
jgi:hypothetical protein